MTDANNGRALIEGEQIVIRVPFSALPQVVEGAWALGYLEQKWRVTDPSTFAKWLVEALCDEDEQGTTPVHKMFDAAITQALEDGADGIEEDEDEEDA